MFAAGSGGAIGGYGDKDFIRRLGKSPMDRDSEDVHVIYSFIRQLDTFSKLGEQALRAICRGARYERYNAHEVLYRKNQLSTCWYILLSGSVFIDGRMYLPRDSFGKRSGNSNHRREHDCLVLEPSEMIVIDFPDAPSSSSSTLSDQRPRKAITSMNLDHVFMSSKPSSSAAAGLPPKVPESNGGIHGSRQLRQNGGGVHHQQQQHHPKQQARHYGKAHNLSFGDMPMVNSTSKKSQKDSEYASTHSTMEKLREVETVIQRSEYLSNFHHSARHHEFAPNHHPPSAAHHQQQGGYYTGTYVGGPVVSHPPLPHRSNSSRSSASSSAYSGSEHLPSTSTADGEDDLAGLPEGNVDSDEDEDDESCPSGDSFMELRDNVRECLEKEPNERTEDDIHVLLDFMQHMPAFANLPVSVKRELCWKMVFAVVEKAGTVVMKDGEQLDSWSVIVNGEVGVTMPDGSRVEYHLGDSFGVEPRPGPQLHAGNMRTMVDDCQFVLVAQPDYVSILSKMSDNFRKHTDSAGEIVSETERRTLESREGYVLIKGKPDKLVQALIEERDNSVDPYYVEDFLLMSRTFIKNPVEIFEKFMHWFVEASLREKVARLVLLWVNNHFNDFETDPAMMKLLEQFEQALERDGMFNHQQLLNIACSVKSRSRTVTYTRSNRDEILHFSILGGQEKSYGVYVSKVEGGSNADKIGLKRGDQILEVNGRNFQNMPHKEALEILRGSTHLSITVKSNLLGFKEMLAADRGEIGGAGGCLITSGSGGILGGAGGLLPHQIVAGRLHQRAMTASSGVRLHHVVENGRTPASPPLHHAASYSSSAMATSMSRAMGHHLQQPPAVAPPKEKEMSKLGRLIKRIKHGSSSSSLQNDEDPLEINMGDISFDPEPPETLEARARMKHSRSNPDISNISLGLMGPGISQYYQPVRSACPEHVLKIYRSDQTFKYLTVYKETTAQNVVQLALQEFGMAASAESSSLEWSLSDVSVTPDGMIRQRRLQDQTQNLAERILLNSRYYLKSNKSTEPLVPDELAPELLKESQTCLLQLNANILAAQMTLQDFAVFAAVEATEFVDNLFGLKSVYGWPKLGQFEEFVNREMWWVATEICKERSVVRRAKIIKKFIKVARHCRDFKNFNSMFALMSGLEKPAVRRLHNTWDKVPSKYVKMFEDLQLLLDPSRNMSKYRQHLAQMATDPPIIPLFPVVKKDLYFIHEANPTWCDGLVNFEKLRMIAKEVRAVTKYASAPYELSSMFEQSGAGRLNDALLHMNTFEGGASVATMRKHYQNRAPLPRKKLYEQALMVRRVKSYLSNMDVIENENELDKLSLECEPQVGSSFTSSAPGGSAPFGRRLMPSPSPSSVSSLSGVSDKRILGPKFGVESPQAVQKMLALVDHSRVRAPMYPPPLRPVHHSGGDASPTSSTSPCQSRRPPRSPMHPAMNGLGHPLRSQSETIPSSTVLPVDLNAESSSVTTLLMTNRLNSSGTKGSVTSTDSGNSQQSMVSSSANMSHAVSCDSTDSGHASGSVSQSTSPPNQRRSYPPLTKQLSSGPNGVAPVQQQPPTATMVMAGGHGSSSSTSHGSVKASTTAMAVVSSAGLRYMHGKIPAVAAEYYGGPHVRRTTSGPSPADAQMLFGQDGEQISRV